MSTTGSVAADTIMSGLTTDTGRSTGRGRGGAGRGRGRGGRSHTRTNGRGGRTSLFKGTTLEMNSNVFECYDEQTDRRQYARTLEALDGYVKKGMKYSEDLAPLFAAQMTQPVIEKPTSPGADADETDTLIWKEDVKEYSKRLRIMRGNLAAIQAVVWGQCSEAMKAKIKSIHDYDTKTTECDCAWLLKNIKAVTMQFDDKRNGYVSLLDAMAGFLNCRQQQGQTADSYLESMKSWVDTIEHHGGSVVYNPKLAPEKDANGITRTDEERNIIARDQTLAVALIRGADPTRYGTLIAELANQYTMGTNGYPNDITSAYSLLVNYCTPSNARTRGNSVSHPTNPNPTHVTPEASAMTFVQNGPVAGTNGVTHAGITCYNCQNMGHYSVDCPQERSVATTTGTTLTQYAYMLAQGTTGINPDWILLDSQSTISVFCNPSMLTNIRPSPHVLRALTNGGHQDSTMLADFPNLGTVWFNCASIANILSLAEVRKICRVTMDTGVEPALCVHRLDGAVMKFREHPCGLYVYAASNDSSVGVNKYTMVTTVAAQRELFTRREIAAADLARDLYRKLGRPSEAEFQRLLRANQIRNCPVTPGDAARALEIYGPDIAALKGKSTRTTPAPRVPTFTAVPLPPPVLTHHRNVTLCLDFFFVQGHAFFHTISRDIGFRTAVPVSDRTRSTILRETVAVIKLYASRGFTVRDLHTDGEFECIRGDVLPVVMNVVAADGHVGEVERSIRTVKERLRSCVHGLPFRRVPKLLITHMVADAIRCLNQFPHPHGISSTLSPASIVTGVAPPDYAAMRLEFGSYVQIFDGAEPTNTIRSRSLGAITLTPTGNAQGDYYFLSLASGARVSRHQWTLLPMTDAAIARVEALALHENQPLIQAGGLVVEWRPDQPIDADEYDRDFDGLPVPDDYFDPADYDAIHPDELADLAAEGAPPPPLFPLVLDQGAHGNYEINNLDHEIDHHDINNDPNENEINENEMNNINVNEIEENEIEENEIEENYEENYDNDNDDDHFANNNDNNDYDEGDELEPRPHENQGAQRNENQGGTHPYNLRNRDTTTVRFETAMDEPHSNQAYYPPMQLAQQRIYAHIMTQMSAKAGIRKHGKEAEAALMAEFAQLEDLNVFEALNPKTLTRQQKAAALRAINLIKEKRDGRLKGRTCADGRPQKTLYDKIDTASPTVATDALMLTIMIEACEARDVATADVAGAYLKADMKDFVIMKFTGESLDILCKTKHEYTQFIAMEGSTKVLYVRLVKALYGCVQSALLWYELFTATLKDMGFTLNPYDHCVANCDIDGSQCTIAWYVDDTKISHVDPNVVTRIIQKIEDRFGKMTVTRGQDHVFLGMRIRYTNDRTAIAHQHEGIP